jgi:hypothetical protein
MPISHEHPSYQGKLRRAAVIHGTRARAAEPAAACLPARRHSGRACCCGAQPAVIAVIPASGARPAPTELLMCGHHYRVSRHALAAHGATLLDIQGYPVSAPWPGPAA